jgi:hypothetical protein
MSDKIPDTELTEALKVAKEKEWYALCDRNYEHAAQVLVEEGYTQTQQASGPFPYLFSKGEEVVYLSRQLGSSGWYPVRYEVSIHS